MAFALAFLKSDKLSAKNIVVDAFLKLYKKRNDFDSPADLEAFLFTTIRDSVIKYRQKCKFSIIYESYQIEPIFTEMVPDSFQVQFLLWADIIAANFTT